MESANDLDVLRPRFEALLGSADVAPFVAELGGAAAGIGILHFRRRLNFTTFEGWISELFVRPAARGQGIGRALLDALVAEWRLRGGHRLQIQVPAQAPAAEALLARAGLEAWMLDFEQRPLAPRDPQLPVGVRLRPAVGADGEAVTGLLSEFGSPRTPPPERMEAVHRTFDDHLRRVEAGEARTVVAEADGAVVGVCSLEWRDPFWTCRDARLAAGPDRDRVGARPRDRAGAARRRRGGGRCARGHAAVPGIRPDADGGPWPVSVQWLRPRLVRPTDCCGRNCERLPATSADRAARVDRAAHRERPVAVRHRSGDGRPGRATHP